MDELQLAESLAALTLRIQKQEIATKYLLQMIAYLVNPDNPEDAYSHFVVRQAAYVAQSPELVTMKSVLETIDRAKGKTN